MNCSIGVIMFENNRYIVLRINKEAQYNRKKKKKHLNKTTKL